MNYQTTLNMEVHAVGTGLHSGNLINMALKPALPNTGIVFMRTDLDGAAVKADITHIDFSALQMATTLRKGEVVVQTTEHLMSALYAMGVDNVVVELSGAEVPIMDGSAEPFLLLIEEAGIRRLHVPRKQLRVVRPFSFTHQGKTIEARPAADFRISYEISFDHPLIRTQKKTVVVDSDQYTDQVAPARTFGFLKDVNYLKSLGLIRGGSLENAVVLDGERILNGSLRLDDEFVSHKILDMVGDFAVCGMRLKGHFTAHLAGHEVHALFMRALLASDCVAVDTEAAEAPAAYAYALQPA